MPYSDASNFHPQGKFIFCILPNYIVCSPISLYSLLHLSRSFVCVLQMGNTALSRVDKVNIAIKTL